MNLSVSCPVFGQSGWEVVCRNLLLALDKLGVNIQLDPKYNWNSEISFFLQDDFARLERLARNKIDLNSCFNLVHQYPTNEYLSSNFYKLAKKSFCLSIFETNKCPQPWINGLNKITKTITFSEFNKNTYTKSGVNNVDVIPLGIDTEQFNPKVVPFRSKKENEFVFLTSGDFTERKNFEGLIEAYVKEFTNKDNVTLIIKAHYQGFIKRYQEECIRKFKEVVNRFNSIDPPRILFFGHKVPWQSVPQFYTAGDCFILTSRGEGIGLPYMEALASGVSVISTNFGGQMQFLTDNNALFVNSDVRVIDDMEYIRKCLWALNHSWAFPDVNDIRNKMRFAYEFRDIMKQKGLQGRADMEKLIWQSSALSLINKYLE